MSSIKSVLKDLVTEYGGTPTGKSTKALLKEALIAKNPLWKLAADVDIDEDVDLLGKNITDLESGIVIDDDGNITGTLKYVTGYTGFSGDPEEQEGYFLALHVGVPDETGVTIVYTNAKGDTVTLDPDGLHIILIKNINKKFTFTASKSDHTTVVKEFNVKGIKLEPATTS